MNRVNDQPSLHDLRILLIGKTGSGVSASGNTILGENVFPFSQILNSTTDRCQKHTAEVSNRRVTVLDTPNFFNSSDIDLSVELKKGLNMCSQGIHAILLVFSLHIFSQPDVNVVSLFKQMFGEKAMKHTLVLFTHGDELQDKSLDQLIKRNAELSKLTEECGGGFHLLNNKNLNNRDQVNKLLMKIEQMVSDNQNSCYTFKMFKDQSLRVFLLRFTRPKYLIAVFLQRFTKPKYLYAVGVVVVFALGCVNVRNEGSFDVKSFLYGCAGGVLSAVTGAASGAVCTQICNNQRWRTRRFTEEELNYAQLLEIMCGCAAGGISGCLMGPEGSSATLLRGLQGFVAHNIIRCHFR